MESLRFHPLSQGPDILKKEPGGEADQVRTSKVLVGTLTLLEEAERWIQVGDLSRGAELLEKAVILNIGDNQLLAKLANIYMTNVADPERKVHLQQASAIFIKLQERDPSNVNYLIDHLKTHVLRHEFAEMEETITLLKRLGATEKLAQLADELIKNPSSIVKGIFIYQMLEKELPDLQLFETYPQLAEIWMKGDTYDYSTLDNELKKEEAATISKQSHRVKPPLTDDIRKLQAAVDEKNYAIRLDANPYIPSRSNQPDSVKAELWINEHPDEVTQAAAKEIVTHTTHVSFEKFQTFLKESVEDFNDRLGADETYVVAIKEDKSNKWVLELALPHLKKLPDQVVDMDNLSAHLKSNPTSRVLFFDDASYSGEQLHTFIQKFVPSESEVAIDVIVPFLSRFAEENIQKASEKVTISRHQAMKVISEEIQDESVLQTLHKMYFLNPRHETKDRGVHSHTLTIFDHKVADYLSTLEDVYKHAVVRNQQGELVERSELRSIIPNATCFVPATLECYKNY